METSTKAKLKVHALEVHDESGNHIRTCLQPGGKYWPVGGDPVHPVHGRGDKYGVIFHEVK